MTRRMGMIDTVLVHPLRCAVGRDGLLVCRFGCATDRAHPRVRQRLERHAATVLRCVIPATTSDGLGCAFGDRVRESIVLWRSRSRQESTRGRRKLLASGGSSARDQTYT